MSPLSAGRLPENVHPDCYHVQLSVMPESQKFSGSVGIEITIQKPTDTITLHALELEVDRAELLGEGGPTPARLTPETASETITLSFAKKIPAGAARLNLHFSGALNQQMRGLYAAKSQGEIYAFSHFEPADARRMIPCFDEPAMKAKFRMRVTLPSELTALSNMPVAEEKKEGDLKTIRFQETPVMSTYLLALAVARLESRQIQVGPTRVSVWTVPGQLHLSDFAFEVTSAVLPLLNDYFDLPYPYPKLDMVSVPDFAMGAMENWGAIFFRDSRLLLDQARSSTATQRRVANVITHEIVHQWFGNLVTMQWWDDLWLNESFATWLACKIVDQWRPEWNSWSEFQQEKEIPLELDALESTRTISTPVNDPAQMEEMFDPLSYEKGAACLRMFEHYLGDEAFRKGIRRYIRKYQFQNTRAEDLWRELSEASGQPVDTIARDWFTQAGFPLVTAHPADGADHSLTLQQRRFHAGGPPPGRTSPVWSIPLTLRYGNGKTTQAHRVLLHTPSTQINLPGNGKPNWVLVNGGESGFLRTDYEPALRQPLEQVASQVMEPAEKIGLLSHQWALAVSGDRSISDFLKTLMAFRADPTRVLVEGMAGYLGILGRQIVQAEDRPRFQALVQELYLPLWKELDWDPRPNEDDEQRLMRAAALWALGSLAQDEDILPELPRRLTLYWNRPEKIDPTLVSPILRLSICSDGGSLLNPFQQKFQTATSPEERDHYLRALASYKKPPMARKVLEFALSDAVRGQDAWRPVALLLINPLVQEEAWNFMRTHWQALREKTGSVGAQRMIQGTQWLWRAEWQKEVKEFFSDPAHQVASAERALAQTLEFIGIGIRFKARQQETLSRWFQDRS